MTLIATEQLSALALLIAFLFGIAFGIVGGAVIGSRLGNLLWPAADGPIGAGARVVFGVNIRGYFPGPRGSGAPGDAGEGDGTGWHGLEVNR